MTKKQLRSDELIDKCFLEKLKKLI